MSPVDLRAAKTPMPDPNEKKLTGKMVLIMLLAFFAVIIAVNVIMMRFAISTMPGVVVKSSYEASQTFNEKVIATAEQQANRHWQVEASVSRADKDNGAVAVSVKNSENRPETGLIVTLRLNHPSDTRQDLEAMARETAPGVYLADFDRLPAGGRDLVIAAKRGDSLLYRSSNRLVVK